MRHEPSEASESGNSIPAASAAACTSLSTMPASTVMLAFTGSTARRRVSRAMETTMPPCGRPPPTWPVLPPCATTATPASAQARTVKATSAVSAGRTTARAWPRRRPRVSER